MADIVFVVSVADFPLTIDEFTISWLTNLRPLTTKKTTFSTIKTSFCIYEGITAGREEFTDTFPFSLTEMCQECFKSVRFAFWTGIETQFRTVKVEIFSKPLYIL